MEPHMSPHPLPGLVTDLQKPHAEHELRQFHVLSKTTGGKVTFAPTRPSGYGNGAMRSEYSRLRLKTGALGASLGRCGPVPPKICPNDLFWQNPAGSTVRSVDSNCVKKPNFDHWGPRLRPRHRAFKFAPRT